MRPLCKGRAVPLFDEEPRHSSVSIMLATAAAQRWSRLCPRGGDPRAAGGPPHRHAPCPRVQAFGLAGVEALNTANTAGSPDRRRDHSSFSKE